MQVDSAAEGELMLGALEAGTHGVVLRTGSAAEVGMDGLQRALKAGMHGGCSLGGCSEALMGEVHGEGAWGGCASR